jgi:CubicO group peptidase (beta-lactamase class C family)
LSRAGRWARIAAIVLWAFSAAAGQGGVPVWPQGSWERAAPEEAGMDAAVLAEARDYALTADGSGRIIRRGRLVMEWGDQKRRYDLKSSTKAIGVTAVGLALKDGKFKGLNDPAKKYHASLGVPPESNAETGWTDKITLFHLATQTAGFDKNGGYTELLFEPGTKWSYSDGAPNWLAECVTLAYERDVRDLMFDRVFGPIGIGRPDLTWRENSYRPKEIRQVKRREFGSGISANVDAMARIGYLYLRQGRWGDEQLIPSWFVDAVRVVPREIRGLPVLRPESYFNASEHYGLLWWNNSDGTMAKVPRDAYWSWGLYDSLIVVIPSLDIVAARAGKSFNRERNAAYGAIEPFIEPIAISVKDRQGASFAPYGPSEVLRKIEWAGAETIVRRACGSDNWPATWGDDDNLYAAYGDGWGFEPKATEKLSLGIAKISGLPPEFRGHNVRTESGERTGDGAKGAKASGMLMVDGMLYMLVRNVANSQVAWSPDRGKTWKWCPWRFTTSFGAPTFLNFGKNYDGARDGYVYVYSHDSDSAYEAADRMVMARVAKDRIRRQDAYQYFKGMDDSGRPVWTKDVREQGAVFVNPGRCYRSGISYNAGLRRYMWCQTLYAREDMRTAGGLGIFDAPEPWGPWTTVFYAEHWDVGPGETSSLPTKWMSADGRRCHLLFSGEDCLSVRAVTFR